jgi:hypothetical protein
MGGPPLEIVSDDPSAGCTVSTRAIVSSASTHFDVGRSRMSDQEQQGDFAAGERNEPEGPPRDFAEGEERERPGAPRDFAEGEEREDPGAPRDFGEGQEDKPADED